MSRILIVNIIRFIILVPVQVLILDKIHFGGHVNPFLYVYFILLLPIETPGWLMLILAFLMGFLIDLFSGTPGLHASACVFMAFVRPVVIRSIDTTKEFESGMQPTIRDLGVRWFVSYAVILIFIHHLALFFLEVFRFTRFFDTLQRALLSALFTLILVIIMLYLFMNTKSRKSAIGR